MRDGRYKFIAAPRRELYDIAGRSRRDAGPRRRRTRAWPTRSSAACATWPARTGGRPRRRRQPRAIDPEVEERLRALGYVASTVTRATLADRPRGDPKDKIGLYNLLKLAAQRFGRRASSMTASRKVREVLAADPEVIEAYTMLGNMHVKAGRLADAIAAYQQALAVDPGARGRRLEPGARVSAGRQGLEEARAGFERVLQLNPRGAKPLYQLADLSMRRGDFAARRASCSRRG